MTLREIVIYLERIGHRITQEIRLQAILHKLPLPEGGLAADAGTQKRVELTPEKEAKLKEHLAESKARVQARFGGGRE